MDMYARHGAPTPRHARDKHALARWVYLLMCLPVMVLAGGLGGMLLGGTVIVAGVRLCEKADDHFTKYGVPALIAVGSLLIFLVLAGVAESLFAWAGT